MSLFLTKMKAAIYRRPLFQRAFYPALVWRHLRRWAKAGPRVKGDGINIVVLNHAWDQDIDAMCRGGDGHESIWELNAGSVFRIVHTIVPKEISDLNIPNEDPRIAPHIARFTDKFIRPLADFLIESTRIDVFVVPGDVFFWVRPLIGVLKERGIPTIVQDKEGTISPSPIMDEHAAFISTRYPRIAERYYYWSRAHREFGLKLGVKPEAAFISGQPRSDFFFHPNRWIPRAALGIPDKAKFILFYTYASDTYLSNNTDPDEKMLETWLPLRRATMDVLRDVVTADPSTYLVIKAHPQQADLWRAVDEWKERGIPRSEFATGAHSSNALAAQADIIIGFQTTAMIEAMTMAKPVIYTGWGDDHKKESDNLIPIHKSGGCDLPTSAEDFRRVLTSYLSGATPPAEQLAHRKTFVDGYFDSADGTVSRRFLDELGALVTSRKGAATPC